MWRKLLDQFLTGMMVRDRLTVQFADGSRQSYGPLTGEEATVRLHDDAILRAICLKSRHRRRLHG